MSFNNCNTSKNRSLRFYRDNRRQISDHQQSWGYEDGPWKGPGPPLLVAADLYHKVFSAVKS